jgi:hypothetical protein
MWVLLTDRKLKGYQIYGPFKTSDEADAIARELWRHERIKTEWCVIPLQIPPRIENGIMIYSAEI